MYSLMYNPAYMPHMYTRYVYVYANVCIYIGRSNNINTCAKYSHQFVIVVCIICLIRGRLFATAYIPRTCTVYAYKYSRIHVCIYAFMCTYSQHRRRNTRTCFTVCQFVYLRFYILH